MKCFKKGGVISAESTVVGRTGVQEDPFDEVNESQELTRLVNDIGIGLTCSPQEYINGDDDVPVCEDGDDWDEQFLQKLSADQHPEEIVDEECDECFDLEVTQPKFRTYQEAVSALEDVQEFLDSKGHNEVATKIGAQVNTVVNLHSISISCTRQTTLDEFF